MTIGCHAHVFQIWECAGGHPSSEIHRRQMQKFQTRTSARDNQPVSGSVLFSRPPSRPDRQLPEKY
jgi:hypothetical protein